VTDGHGKLLRVELRFEDGASIALDGAAAEEWMQQVDGAVVLAHIHGVNFGPLPWQVTVAQPVDSELSDRKNS
jgi:hypothetical protein